MAYARVLLLCSSVLVAGCFNPDANDEGDGSTGADGSGTAATTNAMTSEGPMTSDGTPVPTGGAESGATTATTEPTGADETTEGGPAKGCRTGGTCVSVPDGWSGPVEVLDPESGDDCSAAFGGSFDLQTELFAPDATCGCTCGTLTADCGDVTVLQGQPAQCFGISGVDTPGPGICTGVAQVHACGRGAFADPPVPSCPPQPQVTIPELSWGGSLRVCEGRLTDLGCGDGEQCFPESAGSQLGGACIYREGDVACPTAFPLRMFGAQDVDDQRGCAECTCNAPAASDVVCETQLHIFDDATCTNETGEVTVSGTGFSASAFGTAATMSVEWDAPDVAGPSCFASGVFPTGEAEFIQPTTVCCMP